MPEKKAVKNLQLRLNDESYRRFTVGRELLDIDNDAKMVKHCIEFTLKHLAENVDEALAEQRRRHEDTLTALNQRAKEARETLAS